MKNTVGTSAIKKAVVGRVTLNIRGNVGECGKGVLASLWSVRMRYLDSLYTISMVSSGRIGR